MMSTIDFENIIYDIIKEREVTLEEVSEELHQIIESVCCDYALDNNLEYVHQY